MSTLSAAATLKQAIRKTTISPIDCDRPVWQVLAPIKVRLTIPKREERFMSEMLKGVLNQLEKAARHTDVAEEVLDSLRHLREVLTARLAIRMDNGSRRSFEAWRCRYDDTRGPTRGGIR